MFCTKNSIPFKWVGTHKSQSHKRKIFLGVCVYFSCGCIPRIFYTKQNNFILQLRDALQCRSKNTISSSPVCMCVCLEFIGFLLCVDLWPLKLIFLLVAGHCLVCVKQNNWAAAFRERTLILQSGRLFWLMAGKEKAFRLI